MLFRVISSERERGGKRFFDDYNDEGITGGARDREQIDFVGAAFDFWHE